jgi:prepilin signal peptidase PulO-like enzyme (type II secretory pathway)
MVVIALVLLGLCLGSFVNALVWRICEQSKPVKERKASQKDLSIFKGRSMCADCGHTLHTRDLIPVLSWLNSYGRCRYCHKRIHWQYPLVELSTTLLLVFSYLHWPYGLSGWGIAVFGAWILILTGLIALFVYDVRWMLLPNRIIFPLYGLAAIYTVLRALQDGSFEPVLGALLGVLIGGGIFYLIFQVSKGKGIGGGDVKLGFLLGALVAGPLLAGMYIFVASLLGSVTAALLILSGKAKASSRIPFGPFLIIGAVVTLLFGADIGNWYVDAVLGV